MTKLLQKAFNRASELQEAEQDQFARFAPFRPDASGRKLTPPQAAKAMGIGAAQALLCALPLVSAMGTFTLRFMWR